MIVLFFLWSGIEGLWAVAIPLVFYTLLPVLRNTMVGIQQVDPSLIDAGRGIGMSAAGVLWRVELPLAVPLILAGLRTALVLAVGTATLAFFVNGGGLGELIDTGYKLQLNSVMYVGAALAIGLALLVDWLGGVAEQWLAPEGGASDRTPGEPAPAGRAARRGGARRLRLRAEHEHRRCRSPSPPGRSQPVAALQGVTDHRRLQGLHRADPARLHGRAGAVRGRRERHRPDEHPGLVQLPARAARPATST